MRGSGSLQRAYTRVRAFTCVRKPATRPPPFLRAGASLPGGYDSFAPHPGLCVVPGWDGGEVRISGFDYRRVGVGGVDFQVALRGKGPPVLLLHGFPQTHLIWREVAPLLATDHTVVCADLPGYGDSKILLETALDKRTMASLFVRLMAELGHPSFAAVGHDRGALVAFRLGLDFPAAISHVAVLDVIPQGDLWPALSGVGAVFAAHLPFLAQPPDLPERMIAADPDLFFGHFLDSWQRPPGSMATDVRAEYLAACRQPETIAAICADYRAGAFVDPGHDQADAITGCQLAMPVLAGWQDPGDQVLPFDPAKIWQRWAPDLSTATYECGHFIAEQQPVALHADLCRLTGKGG